MRVSLLLFIILAVTIGTASGLSAEQGGITLQQSPYPAMNISICTTTLLYCGDGTNNCNTVTCTNSTNVTFLTNISDWSEIENLSISAAPYDRVYLNSSNVPPEFRLPPETTEQIIQAATDRAVDKISQAITDALIVLSLLVFAGIVLMELYLKYKKSPEASK